MLCFKLFDHMLSSQYVNVVFGTNRWSVSVFTSWVLSISMRCDKKESSMFADTLGRSSGDLTMRSNIFCCGFVTGVIGKNLCDFSGSNIGDNGSELNFFLAVRCELYPFRLVDMKVCLLFVVIEAAIL